MAKVQSLEQVAKTRNLSLDEMLKERGEEPPQVPWWACEAFGAWRFLNGFRMQGLQPEAIGLDAIASWCRLNKIKARFQLPLARQINLIDRAWLAWWKTQG